MTNKQIFNELSKLIKSNTYTPFSHFKVAAIIVTDKGIFKGINYENKIVTNLGICAERNAIFCGTTHGMKRIYEVHLLTSNKQGKCIPCGACLQVLAEFMKDNDKVFIYDHKGKVAKTLKFKNLLTKTTLL